MDPFTLFVGFVTIVTGITKTIYDINKSTDATNTANKANQLAEDNLELNKEMAGKNFELSKEQFDYQKQLNELTMQREDTAFQRQVADLKAAGLSPLMAAGGASANPLTSANAPHFDMSGINQALGNTISAYNDAFNRKLQSRQFSLQAKTQAAQMYTQLAESVLTQKKMRLENMYLDEKLAWEKKHGFRDLDWRSELLNFGEDLLSKYRANSTIPTPQSIFPQDFTFPKIFGEYKSNDNPSTPFSRSNDQDELNKNLNLDYNNAAKVLETSFPEWSEEYNKALNYFYRFTDAWRDYETVDKFRAAFRDESFRKNIRKKYPLPKRVFNIGK